MTLHLIKLSVGCESISQLEDWIKQRLKKANARVPRHVHVTRMTPKRDLELLDGGSIYWVIKGEIAARQKLMAIEPFRDGEGVGRCRLVMEPPLIAVSPRLMRAFQGWRYLAADDAPADLGKRADGIAAMPEQMRRELRDLGLL
jgi:hypothetical protein